MKIGLFGGTFDPVHYGHVSLARQLLTAAALDEVWFMVTPQNPWKQDSRLSPDKQRLEMVQIALKDEPRMKASDYEFHLEKPSYTYQTLRHLRADYPEHEFVLLIGEDNWNEFDRWSHPDEILEHHRIVVFPRTTRHMPPSPDPRVTIVDAELLPVSSTEIRRRLAAGEDITGLVADGVKEYLKTRTLSPALSR